MLTELTIRDIALIPELRLVFGPGLHVLSGETGAGKSLVVGGLRLLCGKRPPPDIVRSGAERAVVEGIFELDPQGWISRNLAELGLGPENGEIILRREIAASGKGRVRINGATVPLSTLAAAAEVLVDLHGQHDHQSLLRPGFQRDVLDDYAGLAAEREEFGRILESWKESSVRLERTEAALSEEDDRRSLARFQLREIEEIRPEPGELTAAKAELARLEQAEFLRSTACRLVDRLLEGEGSVHEVLGEATQAARAAAEHDAGWEPVAEGLEALAIAAQELSYDARELGERAVHDPGRLAEVRDRVHALSDLLRKYGPEESDLFAFWRRRKEEESDPEVLARRLEALRGQVKAFSDRISHSGESLSRKRKRAARKLRREVEDALADLGMENTSFEVRVLPRRHGVAFRGEEAPERAGSTGLDTVEFLLAPNRGEETKPLRSVASGGEISRVMLAMKSVLGTARGTATMVFDEIDTGVGGRVAGRIGEALAALGRDRQVICITHLAPIASRARVHLRVRKVEKGGRTVSRVEPVEGESRVREIARMLSGQESDGVAVEHARELLKGVSS